MKKLVLFSAILLGSAGLVSAQTGKKSKDTKSVESTKTVIVPASAATSNTARKPSPAKPVPVAAQSLFQAQSAAAKKN